MLEYGSFLALVSAVFVAVHWGGRDERLTAGAFFIATTLSWLLDNQYQGTQIDVLAVDFGLLLGLLGLALTSDRFWPMYAAAFQLVGTVVHVASMTETGDFAWAYAVGLIFWSYAVVAALLAGTWLEGRQRRFLSA
ncbi:hypothetical protein [Sandarakinorhabdus sp.]|jgi:hypothetical protein|uniref:hypothetical protein n=1 Tax=Sandarakinorhabdus sp. TaxID=1916663 RepID=UPI003340A828